MTGAAPEEAQIYGSFEEGPLKGSNVYQDTSQNFIHITEDRLRLRLLENQEANEARDRWQTPVSVAVTLALTLATAEFHDFVQVPADVWEAIAYIVLVVSVIFSVKFLWGIWRPRKGIDDLVSAIKSPSQDS